MAIDEMTRAYAGALFDIGIEKGKIDQIEEELNLITEIVIENRDFQLFLNAPSITKAFKKEFIEKIFSSIFSETIMSFLCVLIDKERQSRISEINESLIELIDSENNRQRVEIVSSVRLDKDILEKIENILCKKLNKNIIITEIIDTSILGGVIIKIGDLIYDGSIIKDLQKMRRNLLIRKVRSELCYED